MQNSKLLYDKGILRNLKMLTQSQYSNFKFVGRIDEIKTFTAGIKSLTFGEIGSFMVNEDGFTCTVEQGKCIQASLFMMPSCFTEFHVDGVVNFSVNMNVLNECLGIFSGNDCGLKIIFKGPDSPLIIILEPHEENDINTECSIKTTQQEELMDLCLVENSASLNVVFIRGPDLMNIFQEFGKNIEELEFVLSPRPPHFKIGALGVTQPESSVEIAKTSDVILLFNCRELTKARYKGSLIRMTQKALSVSSKVAIKTDLSGLLEMHFMIQNTSTAEVYVQFIITPLADTEI